MKKIIDNFLYVMFFFTLVIVISVHSNYYQLDISCASILGIIFIVLSLTYIFINKKGIVYSDILDLLIVNCVIIYSVWAMYNAYSQNISNIQYTIFSILPLIVFVLLSKYIRYSNIDISRFIVKLFMISGLLALIIFILGYSKISYSIKHFFVLVPNSEYISLYGESRLMWVCSHKSRFALFCIIGIWFLIDDQYISIKNKAIFLTIFIIDIYLSGSKTALLCGIFIISFTLKKYIMNLNIFIKAPLIIIALIFFIFSINLYKEDLTKTRDIGNFGLRSYIWESGIDLSNLYPKGIVKFDEQFYLTNENTENLKFTNAHNVFLNQIIEKGRIPGYIYICIFILMLFRFIKYRKYHYVVCFICIILLSCIDYAITSEMNYMFWYCLSVLYCRVKEEKTKRNNFII